MHDPRDLLALDRAYVWHPYAPMPGRDPLLVVASARGVRLRLAAAVEGRVELIDGMSSWWAAIHGYGHPVLHAAITEQLARCAHVMFGGLTHEPAVRLAAKLVEITPGPLRHVFFADSGSVAVEVAVKMCLQHWRGRGRPGKRRLLTWRGGYHGDTFHAMSICDPEHGMHRQWAGVLPRQVFAPAPPAGFDAVPGREYAQALAGLFQAHAHELAAVVVEPIVQGAGGMRFHAPECLRLWRSLADEYDVLLVFDEIATGFGRTGALFASDHAGVSPDVLCLGKALTGGCLSMAATLCTPAVAAGIAADEAGVLAHGPTFMGNPLAAAAAAASIDVLLTGYGPEHGWRGKIQRIEAGLRRGLAPAAQLPGVADVRVLGAIGVVELDHEVAIPTATRAALREGVWLRPFRNLVYTMPPYITDDEDLARICTAMLAAAAAG